MKKLNILNNKKYTYRKKKGGINSDKSSSNSSNSSSGQTERCIACYEKFGENLQAAPNNCNRCKNLISVINISKRSTYFCSYCQI